jgi:sialic acid synthase SpsE
MALIIAEAGVNHNGSLREAEKLIVAAKRCGADAVKFQLFDAGLLKRPDIAHLQLSYDDMAGLKLYAARQGIEFLCSPFDVGALEFLVSIGVKRLKIGSGSITDLALMVAAQQSGLPLIISTGMSDTDRIEAALDVTGTDNVTLLHCTSAYPCPPEDVNLSAMDALRAFRALGSPRDEPAVGYSDHTRGILASLAAVARGATVIEKHLTLDRGAVGPDHLSSANPVEFKTMVSGIRDIETMLGDGIKRVMPSEADCVRIWR